ncbi:MAG: glycosyltransferase family 2 protein [Kiritimatiellae bacterium]|nr:glycosyltransferase family 2 protein [Kiritimatiellia bacterium]
MESKLVKNLSIVIPVKNEEKNLAPCLELLKEFDEVVIVDSGSNDATCNIAAEFNRPVVLFVWDGKFPKKRNWILKNYKFKYPWVLFLDADERMTNAFIKELSAVLPVTKHDAFLIRYDNWFLGRLLKHGDQMRKTALLRVGTGEYERVEENSWSLLDMEVHEHLVVNGSIGMINAQLEHHDKRTLYSYYEKHNHYSSWEANRCFALKDKAVLTRRQKLKYNLIRSPIFPPAYFVYCYFLKLGILDGVAGFLFAISKMFYFYQIQAKTKELIDAGDQEI